MLLPIENPQFSFIQKKKKEKENLFIIPGETQPWGHRFGVCAQTTHAVRTTSANTTDFLRICLLFA